MGKCCLCGKSEETRQLFIDTTEYNFCEECIMTINTLEYEKSRQYVLDNIKNIEDTILKEFLDNGIRQGLLNKNDFVEEITIKKCFLCKQDIANKRNYSSIIDDEEYYVCDECKYSIKHMNEDGFKNETKRVKKYLNQINNEEEKIKTKKRMSEVKKIAMKEFEQKFNIGCLTFAILIIIALLLAISSGGNTKSSYDVDYKGMLRKDPTTWTKEERRFFNDYIEWEKTH